MQIIISKAEEAAESLPAGLKGHPDSSAFDYPAAKHIRDILAQTSDKSLFGGLLGPASVWDKIVRAYEKDSEHPRQPCSESEMPQSRHRHCLDVMRCGQLIISPPAQISFWESVPSSWLGMWIMRSLSTSAKRASTNSSSRT